MTLRLSVWPTCERRDFLDCYSIWTAEFLWRFSSSLSIHDLHGTLVYQSGYTIIFVIIYKGFVMYSFLLLNLFCLCVHPFTFIYLRFISITLNVWTYILHMISNSFATIRPNRPCFWEENIIFFCQKSFRQNIWTSSVGDIMGFFK